MAGGHVMTGEALKKLQQQMKVNRDERRLTVRHLYFLTYTYTYHKYDMI